MSFAGRGSDVQALQAPSNMRSDISSLEGSEGDGIGRRRMTSEAGVRRSTPQAWNTRPRARPVLRGSARRGTRRSGPLLFAFGLLASTALLNPWPTLVGGFRLTAFGFAVLALQRGL